jgi:hypothetical protein
LLSFLVKMSTTCLIFPLDLTPSTKGGGSLHVNGSRRGLSVTNGSLASKCERRVSSCSWGESVFYLKRKEKSPLWLWFYAHRDNIISLSYCLIISQHLKVVLVINYNNHVMW